MVANEQNDWVQRALLEAGRMSELVDTLACVSKVMLRLGEGAKEKSAKKRGGKGETVRL